MEAFNHKGKTYCIPCRKELEADGTAPWQDKCAKCHKVVDLTTDASCPHCGNSLVSNLKRSVNNNSLPSNNPTKSNTMLYVGLAIVGILLVGIVVYFLVRKEKNNG